MLNKLLTKRVWNLNSLKIGRVGSRKLLTKVRLLLLRKKRKAQLTTFFKKTPKKAWTKRLAQKWKWRWNRKTSNVWKQFRFAHRVSLGTPRQIRVKRSFMTNKILSSMLMWRYGLTNNQTQRITPNSTSNRLDILLVMLKYARNIKAARLLITNDQVIVNGMPNNNFNLYISSNDIIQVRGAKFKINSPSSLLKARYLG